MTTDAVTLGLRPLIVIEREPWRNLPSGFAEFLPVAVAQAAGVAAGEDSTKVTIFLYF